MKSLLQERYQKIIVHQLKEQLGISNVMQVPKVEKICLNIGMGSFIARSGSKDYSRVETNLAKISGQKPLLRKARLSVSNFKVREGMPIGLKVTLRKGNAYNFLDKLINIVFPRVRGFRGVKRDIFDKNGNCSIGFNDHTVFSEIALDDIGYPHGVQVTIVTSATDKESSLALLESFDFPFIKID